MAEDFPPQVLVTWSCGNPDCGTYEGLTLDADSRVVAVCLAEDGWQCEDHGPHPGPLDQDAWACSHVSALARVLVEQVPQ